MSKKKKIKKSRPLVKGPDVSDQSVLNKLDKDRADVQKEILTNHYRTSNPYGYMEDIEGNFMRLLSEIKKAGK